MRGFKPRRNCAHEVSAPQDCCYPWSDSHSPMEQTSARAKAQVRTVPPMTADSRPPELDYAFLASWAGIQADGTLTAVGISFLRVRQVATTPDGKGGSHPDHDHFFHDQRPD